MLVIKELKDSELDKAYSLYCDCFNKERSLLSTPLMGIMLGLFKDDLLIGMVQLDSINNVFENKKVFYINSFCIKKEFRNMGYGKRLLNECINIIKDNGGNLINLTSNKNRVYAHMLYKSLGFDEVNTVLYKKDI